MAFLFRDYWPKPQPGELSIHDFGKGADGKRYCFMVWNSGDNRHYYQEDYHDNKWQATWCMDYLGDKGVTEYADVYPKRSYQVWADYRTTAFAPGKEIQWGGLHEIGDEFNAPIQIDPIKSTKFEAPTKGSQRVKFLNQYSLFQTTKGNWNDVIEIEYDQGFGNDPSTGWHGWYVKNVGVVRIIWRYKGADVGGPFDAKVTILQGHIANKYPVLT